MFITVTGTTVLISVAMNLIAGTIIAHRAAEHSKSGYENCKAWLKRLRTDKVTDADLDGSQR